MMNWIKAIKYEKKVKYIALSGFITISIILLVQFVSQNLVIRSIEIEIEKGFAWDRSTQNIHSRIQKKVEPFIGKKVKDSVLKQILDLVHSEPRVAKALVLRLLPFRLLIKIKIRKPLLVLLDKKGTMHPVAIDGTLLPPVLASMAFDLPIAQGKVFFKDQHIRQLAVDFVQQLPPTGGLSQKSISEIGYSFQDDSLYFILSQNGQKIKIGKKLQQINLSRIESVLQYLKQQNIKWRVIDVRFSQKIVVSTRQAI